MRYDIEKSSNIMARNIAKIAKKYPLTPFLYEVKNGNAVLICFGRSEEEHTKTIDSIVDDQMFDGYPLAGLIRNSKILNTLWIETIESIQSISVGFLSSIPSIAKPGKTLLDDIDMVLDSSVSNANPDLIDRCIQDINLRLMDVYSNTLCLFDNDGEYTHDLEWLCECFRETEEDIVIWKAYKSFAINAYRFMQYFYSIENHYGYLLKCYEEKSGKFAFISSDFDKFVMSMLRSDDGVFSIGRVRDNETDEVFHAMYLYTHNAS